MRKKVEKEVPDYVYLFGSPLNIEVYDPPESKLVPPTGAWAMIKRELPPMERDLNEKLTIGRVFWVERSDGADEQGFRSDGAYKILCRSPFGDVCLWPYEYILLDADYLTRAWQEKAFTFHPTSKSRDQFSEQLFYCLSRGIALEDAMVMCLGSMSGPIGWFEPAEEIADFVAMFKNVGHSFVEENYKARARARRRKGARA